MVTNAQVDAALDEYFSETKYASRREHYEAAMRKALEAAEALAAVPEEPEYEWGTKWHLVATPQLPARDVIYPEKSREAAIKLLDDDMHAVSSRMAEPAWRGKLIRRRKAGDWEEVE